jgi:hypothetical protein
VPYSYISTSGDLWKERREDLVKTGLPALIDAAERNGVADQFEILRTGLSDLSSRMGPWQGRFGFWSAVRTTDRLFLEADPINSERENGLRFFVYYDAVFAIANALNAQSRDQVRQAFSLTSRKGAPAGAHSGLLATAEAATRIVDTVKSLAK